MNETVKEALREGILARTLIMGSSRAAHHTKWMLEDFPNLYDGGIARASATTRKSANGAASPRWFGTTT